MEDDSQNVTVVTWTIGMVDSIANGGTNIMWSLVTLGTVAEIVTMRATTLEVAPKGNARREMMVQVQANKVVVQEVEVEMMVVVVVVEVEMMVVVVEVMVVVVEVEVMLMVVMVEVEVEVEAMVVVTVVLVFTLGCTIG